MGFMPVQQQFGPQNMVPLWMQQQYLDFIRQQQQMGQNIGSMGASVFAQGPQTMNNLGNTITNAFQGANAQSGLNLANRYAALSPVYTQLAANQNPANFAEIFKAKALSNLASSFGSGGDDKPFRFSGQNGQEVGEEVARDERKKKLNRMAGGRGMA